jgi:hypothetical protein
LKVMKQVLGDTPLPLLPIPLEQAVISIPPQEIPVIISTLEQAIAHYHEELRNLVDIEGNDTK